MEWPNSKVQPVLITYNRANLLRKILTSFVEAGLSSMELTVLDNASTDHTAEVVSSFQKLWPNLRYQRNRYNIGGNPNFLRALELGDSEYCWVIGDDDAWFLDDMSEFIGVLNDGTSDIIRLGWLVSPDERGKHISIAELAKKNSLFFASVSMISSVVVKRSLITEYLPESYLNVGDVYPQLVPFFKNAESTELLVYSLKKDLMTHTPSLEAGYFLSDLEWIACYCRSSRFVENDVLKDKVIHELMSYLREYFKYPRPFTNLFILLFFAMKSKAYGFNQTSYIFTIFCFARVLRPSILITALVYFLTPRWLIRFAVRSARKRANLSTDLDEVREYFLNGRRQRL